MTVYLDVLVLLNFAVNYCLLWATARLTGIRGKVWRLGAGAAVGALYAGLTVLPPLTFLGNNLWRTVFLGLMAVTAFGTGRGRLRCIAVLLGLSLALGGLALCLRLHSFWALILGAAAVGLLCRLFLRGGLRHAGQLVPVSIRLGARQANLTALRDSGNTLRDPFSGEPVLVAQADAAGMLLEGIDLSDPCKAMEQCKGLKCRLIPYRALGGSGVLLAVKCDRVTINGKEAGPLVAFSPEPLSPSGEYQALTGGGQYG